MENKKTEKMQDNESYLPLVEKDETFAEYTNLVGERSQSRPEKNVR